MTSMDTDQNVFSISDAKIAKVTTNTSANYAISTRVEIPELSTMDVTVKTETKDAKYGAGQLADSFTVKTGFDVKFESVNIPLAAIALINGSTLTQDSATAGSEVNTLSDKSTDVPVMFNLAFKTDFVNGEPADFHMEIFCVKGYMDVVTKTDDYWTCSFTGVAVGRKNDKKIRDLIGNKTAIAIASV